MTETAACPFEFWRLYHGDCLAILKTLPANSVDSVVTDPPAGIAFMGKAWDSDKGGRDAWIAWLAEVMRECLRVLKPGGHALVWSIPRTSHWTATALEDAGFEIRDCVTHLFGSGFPKSLDVSKAIDKAAGAERKVIGVRVYADGTKGHFADAGTYGAVKDGAQKLDTTAATDDAKRWQGFGTALKPAAEFWWLCRKPLSEKTVAANVLKWGTGAINVDGCRIVGEKRSPGFREPASKGQFGNSDNANLVNWDATQGRFPANLVLSCCGKEPHDEDCAAGMLDAQSGFSKTPKAVSRNARIDTGKYGNFGATTTKCAGDSGGASRFFYCAKSSKSDRGADNGHPCVKSTKLMAYLCRLVTPPGGTVLDPFMGSGSTGVAALREDFQFIGIEQDEASFDTAKARLP